MTRLRLYRLLAERAIITEARRLGTNSSDLSRVERGVIPPTPKIARALEKKYGRPISDLLEDIGAKLPTLAELV